MPICNICKKEVTWNDEYFVAETDGLDLRGITKFLNLDGSPHKCGKNKENNEDLSERDKKRNKLFWAKKGIEYALNGFFSKYSKTIYQRLRENGVSISEIIEISCIDNIEAEYFDIETGFPLTVKNLVLTEILLRNKYGIDEKFIIKADKKGILMVYLEKK